MVLNDVVVGQKVIFKPLNDDYAKSYMLDGVLPGDVGVVVRVDDDGDVLVNFTRQDGTACDGFYAFVEDLEEEKNG